MHYGMPYEEAEKPLLLRDTALDWLSRSAAQISSFAYSQGYDDIPYRHALRWYAIPRHQDLVGGRNGRFPFLSAAAEVGLAFGPTCASMMCARLETYPA